MVDHAYILPRSFALKTSGVVGCSLGAALHGAQGRVSFAQWQTVARGQNSGKHPRYGPLHPAPSTDSRLAKILTPLSHTLFDMIEAPLHMPMIMGILNVTDDSFSDGGQYNQLDAAVARALQMEKDGAAILDIGGESTRPNAPLIPIEEEKARVVPVIKAMRLAGVKIPISIDSRKAGVMEAALEAGASLINDVSALSYDPKSVDVAKEARCPVVLMHSQGTPDIMQSNPNYDHVVLDIYDYLKQRLDELERQGIHRQSMIVDPGFGFGKTFVHNVSLLNELSLFHGLEVPVLVGGSRKSFIGALTGEKDPSKRVLGSVGFALRSALQGAQILRVHDVKATIEGLKGFGF